MRHGEAGEAVSDADRPLTARGQKQAKASAQALKTLGARPPVIWHSPYLRARQTAEEAAGVFGAKLVPDPRFTPGGDPEEAAKALLGQRDGVLLVAHLPILPAIVDLLGAGRISLGTAGVVHLGVAGGTAVLCGLLSAEFLERVR